MSNVVRTGMTEFAARQIVTPSFMEKIEEFTAGLDALAITCHVLAVSRGWWHDSQTGDAKELNIGERYALMHSELSEGLEAVRKDLVSDHIPEFTGEEEELSDVLIRLLDYAGAKRLRLGEAFIAKLRFNAVREDYSVEARECEGGKKF